MPYKAIRENFSRQCAIILSSYRKHCSNQSPPGQLILPESLKLLPMYANCLLKSDALLSRECVRIFNKPQWWTHVHANITGALLSPSLHPSLLPPPSSSHTAPIVSLDEKCWLMFATLSMTLHQSVTFFYPKMMALVSMYSTHTSCMYLYIVYCICNIEANNA